MFWGLILKANKKYTQTTKQAFHVSQAALDVTSCSDGPIQLFLTYENVKYLICTLRKNTTEQVMLDLNFNEGDEISLQSQGNGTIHISGYITDLSDQMDDLSDEDSDAMEELMSLSKKSKKPEGKANNSKSGKKAEAAAAADEDEDDEEEDDSDFNGEVGAEGEDSDDDEEEDDEDGEEEGDDDDDDDEEDEEEEEESDEEVQQPKAKQIKLEKPKQNGVETQKKDPKQKAKKEAGQQQQPAQKQKGGEQTLAGGVKIEDIRVGSGPEAKSGKRAQVYYEGRLKTNNKVFDSLKQGVPFKFGLGRGEVIKGWDVGVVGMKVGGKRRITCPPHMAYGARGSPPTIPPNSTLVFEVELKGL